MHNYPGFDPVQWKLLAVQIALLVVLLSAASIYYLRPSRPPLQWDLVVWMTLGGGLFLFGLYAELRVHPATVYRSWLALGSGIWGCVGALVTVIRLIRSRSRTEQMAECLTIIAIGCVIFSLLLPPRTSHSPESYHRRTCKENLKQLAFAFHDHHDAHQSFPSRTSGTPERSWRVEILPWLKADDIRSQYHDEAAWNSAVNHPVSTIRTQQFTCPSDRYHLSADRPQFTAYAIPYGPHGLYSDGPPRTLREISDGTSNTILLVEACGQNIVWTEPRDVNFETEPVGINLPGHQPGESAGIISSFHSGGAQVALADGSVRYLSQTIDPSVLKSLLVANDGGPHEGF